MRKFKNVILFIALILSASNAFAQTTNFTYQGKLTEAGLAATGQYDFTFKLYNSMGNQVGLDVLVDNVQVTAGIFTVNLDFALLPFTSNAARFLEISVRPGASAGAYTTLTPRQPLTSSPYAIQAIVAGYASFADNAANLNGVAASGYVLTIDTRLSDARNPLPNSPNYIQNIPGIEQQPGSFNITGGGSANIFNATTQYNIGGNRVLSVAGSFNTFAGINAGIVNSNGVSNSFFGTSAGQANTDGISNSFFGAGAGQMTTSDSNSFFGQIAGKSNTIGFNNSFFGRDTGQSNTMGSNNTLIGYSANVGLNNLSNATAIGANAVVSQSNSLVLGNGVNVGIGTTTPRTRLDIVGVPSRLINIESSSPVGTWLGLNNMAGGRSWNIISSGTGNGEGAGKLMFFDETTFATRMTIDENGNVVINVLGAPGSTSLCRNALNQISTCTPGNLSEQSELITKQQTQIERQQREIDELKQIVCTIKPDAAICKEQQ